MIRIKADKITNRLQYTLDFVFSRSEESYEFVDDQENFYYSANNPKLTASTILFETEIRSLQLEPSFYNGQPCLSIDGFLDPLATIFLCISRYEEYNNPECDEHDRFPARVSFMHQFGWMSMAVADRLVLTLLKELAASVKSNKVRIIPTFDIDNTFAYKEKRARQKLSIIKDVIKGNKARLAERNLVAKGAKDPYDSFDKIENIAANFDVKIFWLLADWSSKDRNISWQNVPQEELIKRLSNVTEIGIHPGYKSFLSEHRVKKEKERLAGILEKSIINSRQHFLRMRIPDSYRILLNVGIVNDYTMGFASEVGFRAGTSTTYNWFDIEYDQVTDLKVHPFVYMDGTLNEYMKLDVEAAKEKIRELFEEVSNYGEQFMFLWHNETIGDYGIWNGWSEVLEYTLNLKNE